jgi:hypothetical protein
VTPLSIAHLPPGSPAWLFVLIVGALALHIGAGSIGLVTGYAAILAPKGGPLHRRAGAVFVIAMIAMGIAAAFLALRIHQRGNVTGGAFAAYLVTTGWMTVRRPPDRTGRFEALAFVLVAALGLFFAASGVQAMLAPSHRLDGYPPALYLVVASLAAFFAWGDWRMLRRGGLAGTARSARHAGRMGFALFLAAGSFFIGQQKAMPPAVRGSPWLFVLGLAPLALMLFWLVRIRLPKRGGAAAMAPAQ